MKPETLKMRIEAFDNAAEMIRGHVETGMTEEAFGGDLGVYTKQCEYVANVLTAKADKLRNKPVKRKA